MSGRRRRSESLWDRKEDAFPQNEPKEFHSPKRSNSEANDVLMSDDFNENILMDNDISNDRQRMKMDHAFDDWESQYNSRPSDNSYRQPYRGGGRGGGSKESDRSRSPNRTRGRDCDRGGTRGLARSRSRSRSRGRDQGGGARSPSRGGGSNRLDNDSAEKRPEYSGGSRFRDDRNSTDYPRTKGSDGTYRKDTARNYEDARDYHRNHRSGYDNDQDHRRQSNQTIKQPCRFFTMGRCNRNNCKFSHDIPKSGGYEERSHDNDTALTGQQHQDHDFPTSNPHFDDKNKSWNDPSWNNLDSGVSYNMGLASNQESHIPNNQQFHSYGEPFTQNVHNSASQFPSDLNRNGSNLVMNGSAPGMLLHHDKEGGEPVETSKNDIPQLASETIASTQIPLNLNIMNAPGLLSLPNSGTSGGQVDSRTLVNEPVKTSVPVENQILKEPVGNLEANENKIAENPKNEQENTNPGKIEEGNIGNDEKAMRQFKVALVEFVKEILKPTWKEGKMSREVYKTIVKKVVEKVTGTIQGVQIPRTQEKIDQYLAFSKSKITKLVEAYVGRLVKAQ